MKRSMLRTVQFAAAGIFAIWTLPARGDERPPCDRFDWPLTIERRWFEAADLPIVETGAILRGMPANGLSLKLRPASGVAFAAPPSRPSKPDAKAGVVSFEVPGEGLYQVTIASDGWVDVVQGGAVVAADSHTGSRGCSGLRKSVRFKLRPGAATIQVTGADGEAMAVGIRRVD